MRLRTFTAASMAEAIDLVRRELGSDAIIVSNHVTKDGRVEVTAASENPIASRGRPDAEASKPALSSLPTLEATLEERLRERLRNTASKITTVDATPLHSGISFDATRLADALNAQGLPQDLRDGLVNTANAFREDDAVVALSRALEVRLTFEPIAAAPRAPIMLIGLPGSGKTVTMAKLAANAIMDGLTVDLISTDTERAGAAPQGAAYSELLGQKFSLADSADALSLLLEENAASGNGLPNLSAHPCFIDTASINPFDRVERDTLKQLVDIARSTADAEPVLVLAATGDVGLMCEVAEQFANLGARRLVATQVDISRRIGPILAAADASRLALAQISITPYLARGLNPMHPMTCARLILQSSN